MKCKSSVVLFFVCIGLISNVTNVFGLDRASETVENDYDDGFYEAEELTDGVPPGHMLIEGDIIVPEDFLESRSAYQTNLWTNNTVPYEFDANVTALNRTLMQAAMQEWENVSDADFVHCASNTCTGNHLHIQNSTRNSSFIGMVVGQQVVNIFNWNFTFIMAHELGHALGYWHEHQRADQNQYLQIHSGNADPAGCNAACFATNFNPDAPNNYGPFDFDSVMHYGECAFALAPCPCGVPSNCQTIEVRMDCDTTTNRCTNTASAGRACTTDAECDPRSVGECNTTTNLCEKGTFGEACFNDGDCDIVLGQREHFSKYDELTMSFLYAEPDWRFVDNSYTGTESGTFLEPFQAFNAGASDVPSGGTVIIQPGSYNQTGTYTKTMTLRAPLGGVVIGQ